jgi:D-serine ammonia-lyase
MSGAFAISALRQGLTTTQVLYGLPVTPAYLSQLEAFRSSVKIVLMIDSEQHVAALEKYGAKEAWEVFVKVDVGSSRAGVLAGSSALQSLVKRADESPAVQIYGFYCHAGHSYASRTSAEAEAVLQTELSGVLDAAKLLPADREVFVSIGSTPTAHVAKSLQEKLATSVKLELHAGMTRPPTKTAMAYRDRV